MTSCFYLWRHISMVPQMGQRVQNGHVTCIVGVSMEIAFWRHFSSLYLWRSGCVYPSDFEGKCMLDFDWKVFVRSGIRTHAHRSGLRPERSALDRSAILTSKVACDKASSDFNPEEHPHFSGQIPKTQGPTEIRTRIAGFKVQSANHYTIEPWLVSQIFKVGKDHTCLSHSMYSVNFVFCAQISYLAE